MLEDLDGTGYPPGFVRRYNQRKAPVDPWVREAFPTIAATTFFGWLRLKNRLGDRGLVGNYGNRRGSGFFGANPGAATYIKQLLKSNPQLSANDALKALQNHTKKRPLPSLRTIQRYIQELAAQP